MSSLGARLSGDFPGPPAFPKKRPSMSERMINDPEPPKPFSAEITELTDGRVLRYRLHGDKELFSWSDIVDRWQNDRSFRTFFISLLVDAPFPAYYWETPPITVSTMNKPFEFVLVDSQTLVGVQRDEQAFAEHFNLNDSVVEFSNLGGDATLVAPCPREPLSAYAQISTFVRGAPEDQQHQLWALAAVALKRRLGDRPVWVSTSGLGVYWLHIRLDSVPKYYTYEPYRVL